MVAAMASLRLQPPEPFHFARPDTWARWKRRYEQFHMAAGLADEDELRQVNTLLYCLGPEAEDVLASTNISSEERQKYSSVLKKLDEFFQVRKNTIFERARFNRRDQLDGESADEYIAVLHSLAEDCEYGALKGELIRDRLVVGIRDTALSQKLQLDPLLTLDKAQKSIRQNEAVKSQQAALHETPIQEPNQVDQMRQEKKTGPT